MTLLFVSGNGTISWMLHAALNTDYYSLLATFFLPLMCSLRRQLYLNAILYLNLFISPPYIRLRQSIHCYDSSICFKDERNISDYEFYFAHVAHGKNKVSNCTYARKKLFCTSVRKYIRLNVSVNVILWC